MRRNLSFSQCIEILNFRIYAFSEKIQSKLFAISNNLIKLTLAQKLTEKRDHVNFPSQKDVPGLVENI